MFWIVRGGNRVLYLWFEYSSFHLRQEIALKARGQKWNHWWKRWKRIPWNTRPSVPTPWKGTSMFKRNVSACDDQQLGVYLCLLPRGWRVCPVVPGQVWVNESTFIVSFLRERWYPQVLSTSKGHVLFSLHQGIPLGTWNVLRLCGGSFLPCVTRLSRCLPLSLALDTIPLAQGPGKDLAW